MAWPIYSRSCFRVDGVTAIGMHSERRKKEKGKKERKEKKKMQIPQSEKASFIFSGCRD